VARTSDIHGQVSSKTFPMTSGFDRGLCVGGLFQREGVPDDRLEPARRRLGQRALGQQLRVPWGEAHVVDPAHGHSAALRLSRVELGEAAAGCAVCGEPAAGRRGLERGSADLPADAVEDHVRPVAAGCLAHLLGPVRLGVVDYGVGAQLPGQVELLLPACGPDGPGAGRVRQLNQQAAETAGRRGDEYPLVRLELNCVQQAQRGDAVVKQRRRLPQTQARRHSDQAFHRDQGPLGVTAVFACPGDDLPADPVRATPSPTETTCPATPPPGKYGGFTSKYSPR
jgi:hypothetical protein